MVPIQLKAVERTAFHPHPPPHTLPGADKPRRCSRWRCCLIREFPFLLRLTINEKVSIYQRMNAKTDLWSMTDEHRIHKHEQMRLQYFLSLPSHRNGSDVENGVFVSQMSRSTIDEVHFIYRALIWAVLKREDLRWWRTSRFTHRRNEWCHPRRSLRAFHRRLCRWIVHPDWSLRV